MAKQMNWYRLEQTLRGKKIAFFTPLDIKRIFGVSAVAASFLLYRYAKQKLIIRLKRGLYTISDKDINDLCLANKLYEPSYISLEFALSFHGVIPETVYEITSITTKSTRRFTAIGKTFSYRRIKQEAFTGYSLLRHHDAAFLMADPEKALVDCVYLKMRTKQNLPDRLNKNKIDKKKVFSYVRLFHDERLMNMIKTMML